MPRLTRIAIFLAVAGLSSSALACRYTVKGKIYENGRWWKVRAVNQPCYDAPPGALVAQAQVYVPPPPMVYAPPPPAYYAPPPPPPVVYAPPPPPVVYAPPPVAYGPPPRPMVVANAPIARPRDDRPSLFALKWSGGATSSVAYDNGLQFGSAGFAQDIGLEVRLNRWFALTSDLELRPDGGSWDMIGAKVWLIPHWALKPFAQVALAGSESYSLPGKFQLGLSAALGLDLFFGKHFFIEAEAKYRVSPGAGDCCREVPHLAGTVGAGVAFF